jgi:hypothetical protein
MFKKGDKVKVIKSDYFSVNEVGDIGIITDISGPGFAVEVKGNPNMGNWHYGFELELVEKEKISNEDDKIAKYKLNAEEDYLTTPISVLRYISILESKLDFIDLEDKEI